MKINNTMKYKGYIGSVEFSEEDKIFFGRVLGIHTYVSYDGKDVDTLISSFHQMVDDYLLMCKENNIEPEIGYKGSFNIRVSPENLGIGKNPGNPGKIPPPGESGVPRCQAVRRL